MYVRASDVLWEFLKKFSIPRNASTAFQLFSLPLSNDKLKGREISTADTRLHSKEAFAQRSINSISFPRVHETTATTTSH